LPEPDSLTCIRSRWPRRVAPLVIASLATSQTGSRIGSALIGTAVLLLAAVALGILGF
jgi:hypothetical protein